MLLPPTWMKLENVWAGTSPAALLGELIRPGPQLQTKILPNYCCCCWVQLFVNKIWPRPWHESKPLLNRCPPRRGTGLFSECLVKRGLRLEHKALELSQRAEERGAGGAAWKDRSNCRAGRSPGVAGREMKEAQMSPWWTSSRCDAFKRWEHNEALTGGRSHNDLTPKVWIRKFLLVQ